MTVSKYPVVLVTGASRGLGLAITSILLRGSKAIAPSNVITISRSVPNSLQQLSKEQQESKAETSLIIKQGDVCSEIDTKQLVEEAITKWGRLDAVVLNAGVIEFARLADIEPSSFAHQISVNVCSLATTLHFAIPHLRQSPTGCGKAVFVSSGASVGNTAAWSAYNASKAAMNAIARTLATEEEKIASWAIRPGVIATSMQEQVRDTGKDHMTLADYDKFHKMHADGTLLQPNQPGHVIASLAVNGTRLNPKNNDNKGAGETGSFINWNDEVLADYQLP